MCRVTYSTVGEYLLPNFAVPDDGRYQIGAWGRRRLEYLKKHKRLFYVNLLSSGKLIEHLCEIDTTASERQKTIVQQVAAAQGVTERLKEENQMLWVGSINNILACAGEVILKELIYN